MATLSLKKLDFTEHDNTNECKYVLSIIIILIIISLLL